MLDRLLSPGYVSHPLAPFVVMALATVYIFGLMLLAPAAACAAYENPAAVLSNYTLIFSLAYILSAATWVINSYQMDQVVTRHKSLAGELG